METQASQWNSQLNPELCQELLDSIYSQETEKTCSLCVMKTEILIVEAGFRKCRSAAKYYFSHYSKTNP